MWASLVIAGMILAVGCASSSSNGLTPNDSATSAAGVANPQQPTSVVTEPFPTATLLPPEPEGVASRAERAAGPLAAEVGGIAKWINSKPLTIGELRGKVVLVDFWTYTCVNCIRTFPFLRDWNNRYADSGLVILGIHTPEFEFEKDFDNVVQATKEHDIVWPVAQDNDYVTWRSYENRSWPAKYLIDKDGVIRYTHFGEGAYAETEAKIIELLLETGADLANKELDLPEDPKLETGFRGLFRKEVTPELYAGYGRNFSSVLNGRNPYVVQQEFYDSQDQVTDFAAPDELEPSKIYFNGPWLIEEERSKHARVTENYEDYIDVKYSAKSVNLVLTSDSGEPYKVRLTVDGKYLTEENKGQDVIIGEDGESYILVTEPRLYALLENSSYVRREVLRMSSNSDDFSLFAFTFGVYQGGL